MSQEQTKDSSHRSKMYLPIGAYAVIGNLHTVALVGKNGSIDWCCIPRFDAPSVFGALLDAEKGGFFHLKTMARAVHEPPLPYNRGNQYISNSKVRVIKIFAPIITRLATTKISFLKRNATGKTGFRSVSIRGVGAKWCIARPSF